MNSAVKAPQTLLEAVTYFADERKAWEYFVARRWPDAVTCPRCGSGKVHLIESRMVWRCNGCTRQFSVKVGTIFEDSPIKLSKWLPAMWLIGSAKNGISSCELARALGVTQKTAWFMLHRIRLAMQNGTFEKLGDHVEVDETYIGGKARNMHAVDRKRKIKGTGGARSGKAIVMGMLERGGTVRTIHVEKPNKKTLQGIVKGTVHKGSNLYTDALLSYRGLSAEYVHGVIDHATAYVEGSIHTDGLENYWSLLKRTISGTYVSVEPFHLHRYLDEQSFRYNERDLTDGQRFGMIATQAVGKRLTYKTLAGKVGYAGA